jgi:hypothetical protein
MANTIRFGVDAAHSDYVIPVAIITLYSPKGKALNVPSLCIRMGGTFSTAIRAAYDDAQGIMGTPFEQDSKVLEKIGGITGNALTGLQAQIVKGALGAGGVIASGGQSGRQQIEFLSRVFMSNFQQVVYRGPSFRIFTLPFVMKPTSKQEAENMLEIIQYLKISTVPEIGATNLADAIAAFTGGSGESVFSGQAGVLARIVQLREDLKGKKEEEIFSDENLKAKADELNELSFEAISFEDAEKIESVLTEASPITFNYPNTCEFELALYQPSKSILKKVFKSKKCVIESVVADYGSSNKMTFFQDDYYPTEVGLTLNLKELEFQTTASMYDYFTDSENYTII